MTPYSDSANLQKRSFLNKKRLALQTGWFDFVLRSKLSEA